MTAMQAATLLILACVYSGAFSLEYHNGCENMRCIGFACDLQKCPAQRGVRCEAMCNGCIARFVDKYGNDVTDRCQCSGGEEPHSCKNDPCDTAKCDKRGECRTDTCGGCDAVFYDRRANVITSCPIQGFDPRCPAVRKDQAGICVHACSSNADCRNKQICCSNGCGSQCQNPPLDDRCPPPDPEIIKMLPVLFCAGPICMVNEDCKRNDICCTNGCQQRCISPPFTDPRCPKDDGQFGICVNLCTSNKQCSNNQICCSNGCGTQCRDVPQDQDDRCPPPDPEILAQLPFIICPAGTCSDNSQCRGDKICCNNGCSKRCIDPPGYDPRCPIPVFPVSIIPCGPKLCSSSKDCRSDYMCCGLWCGSQCMPKAKPCEPGEYLAKCRNVCANLKCPSHPTAQCRVHGCNGCRAEFYDQHDRIVKDCFGYGLP